MPEGNPAGYNTGPDEATVRVADLFRMRNADRLGLQVSDQDHARDQELTEFGASIGIGPRGGQQPMPGQPHITDQAPAPSAGDALASGSPVGQTAMPRQNVGVPGLGGRQTRGLYHNRTLGRVVPGATR